MSDSETTAAAQAPSQQTDQKESDPNQSLESEQASPDPGTGNDEAPDESETTAAAQAPSQQTEQKESDPDQTVESEQPSPDPGTGNDEAPDEERESGATEGESVDKSESKVSDIPGPGEAESPAADASSPEHKVAIITGANTSIGLVAAGKLAKDGYEVIMACRNEEKATAAVKQVEKEVPEAKVSFMKLDLSSLESVREFAAAFCALGKPLHVLCNNAGLTTGLSVKERFETEDGFEMTFGVNHLGHFLLTHLLLEELKKSAAQCGEARIVHTASMVHDPETMGGKRGQPAHLDFDNLMLDKPGTFDGEMAYRHSKLANCAFSVELAKRLEGTNVTSNTLCPGFIPSTGLLSHETFGMRVRLAVIIPVLKLMGRTRTVEHGGATIYDVATNSEWKGLTGKHFTDFKEIPSSKESRDPEVGKKLWDVSADLVKYEQAKAL